MLGRECLVHTAHEQPVPIQPHHVRPMSRGGSSAQAVGLCANAHGRIHHLLDEIEAYALASPYATVDEVLRAALADLWRGSELTERAIAGRGWQSYGLGFLNGRYAGAYRMWRTDGAAKEPDVPHFTDLLHAARWSRRWRRELGLV
jgi:hypothetical protein